MVLGLAAAGGVHVAGERVSRLTARLVQNTCASTKKNAKSVPIDDGHHSVTPGRNPLHSSALKSHLKTTKTIAMSRVGHGNVAAERTRQHKKETRDSGAATAKKNQQQNRNRVTDKCTPASCRTCRPLVEDKMNRSNRT